MKYKKLLSLSLVVFFLSCDKNDDTIQSNKGVVNDNLISNAYADPCNADMPYEPANNTLTGAVINQPFCSGSSFTDNILVMSGTLESNNSLRDVWNFKQNSAYNCKNLAICVQPTSNVRFTIKFRNKKTLNHTIVASYLCELNNGSYTITPIIQNSQIDIFVNSSMNVYSSCGDFTGPFIMTNVNLDKYLIDIENTVNYNSFCYSLYGIYVCV